MNKKIKILGITLLSGLYLVPQYGMSDTAQKPKGDWKKMSVADRKTHILAELDEKIAKFQAAKTCVNAASTDDALKACRPKMEHHGHGPGDGGGPGGSGPNGGPGGEGGDGGPGGGGDPE